MLLQVQFFHNIEQVGGGGAVEVGGGFIGQYEGRLWGRVPLLQRPFVADHQRVEKGVCLFCPPARRPPIAQLTRLVPFLFWPFLQQHHKFRILLYCQHGDQVIALKNEADFLLPEIYHLVISSTLIYRYSPSTSILPFVGWSRPPIMFSKVVLPEPDGPTIAVNSPFSMVKSTPPATHARALVLGLYILVNIYLLSMMGMLNGLNGLNG